MHEWAERAVNAARRLGDAPLTAAALAVARARGVDDRARPSAPKPLARRRRRSSTPCRTTSSPATSRPRPGSPASELYLDRYAEADAHADRALAVARATGQGEHFLVLVADPRRGVWRLRGKLAEAGELLDGGIEAARLLGNTHALVWSLSGRSVRGARGSATWSSRSPPRRRASTSAADADATFHSAEAAADLAAALLETGQPRTRGRAASRVRRAARSWRSSPVARGPVSSSCSRAAGSRSTAWPTRERAAAARGGLGLGRAAPDGRRLGRSSGGGCRARTPATPRAQPSGRSRRPPPPTRSGRRSRRRCRARSRAARSPQAGERERAADRAPARGPRVRGARRAALPGRGGTRAAKARPSHPPSHAPGQDRRGRHRVADRTRAPAGAARRRPQDECRDRRGAVPQPEDGRDAPAQHLPQARRRARASSSRAPSSVRPRGTEAKRYL